MKSFHRYVHASGSAVVLCFILGLITAKAQTPFSFRPLQLHTEKSRTLIRDVEEQLSSEAISSVSLRGHLWIQGVQSDRSQLFRKLLRGGAFIQNDTLESFASNVLERVIAANQLPEKKRTILVLNSPEPNAFCYGPGLFVVTVGLLGKIDSEEEFAFILSHEVAHDELRHIESKLKREADTRYTKNSTRTARPANMPDAFEDAIADLSEVLYKSSDYNRHCEYAADSLGLQYLIKSGYSSQGAIEAMNMLDISTEPMTSDKNFFLPLQFTNYPFKNYWLNSRLSVYGHRPAATFFFASDSLLSHPELQARKIKFISYIEDYEADHNDRQFDEQLAQVIPLAEFQTVEAAYLTQQYDLAFFQILELQHKYSGNPYLVSRSAKLLIDIFNAKDENTMSNYVARYTNNYSPTLKEVNNLLFNISKEEAAEIAFHIVNNQSNFDSGDRSHYYLLWKICRLTRRETVKTKIEQAYSTRFGKRVESYTYR